MRNAILLMALLCAACSNYSANLPSIKPYKMDVQQGNVVTSKMMMQLRPGMTKAQVRFVMGTPLITDSFHVNRWDYVYRMQKGGKLIESRRVILDFENDLLKRVRGDVIPAGSDAEVAAANKPANQAPRVIKPAVATKPKEKGMLDTLMFWKGDEQQPVPAEATPADGAPEPAEASAQPVAEPEKQEKGMLDSLKFWKKDDAPPEAQAAPQAMPAPRSVVEPESTPVGTKPAAGAKPVEEAQSAVEAEPVVESKPVAAVTSAPKSTAPAKAASMDREEPKPVPRPEVELPPEEDPSYFERMLERIGF
jgi:outer membrane protein assembly factor BamE